MCEIRSTRTLQRYWRIARRHGLHLWLLLLRRRRARGRTGVLLLRMLLRLLLRMWRLLLLLWRELLGRELLRRHPVPPVVRHVMLFSRHARVLLDSV